MIPVVQWGRHQIHHVPNKIMKQIHGLSVLSPFVPNISGARDQVLNQKFYQRRTTRSRASSPTDNLFDGIDDGCNVSPMAGNVPLSIGKKLSFQRNREAMAQKLLIEYDRAAFGGSLLRPQLFSSPTGKVSELPNVTIQWSNRLRTTAGRAHLKLHSPRKGRKKLSRKDHIHQMELQAQKQPNSCDGKKTIFTGRVTAASTLQASHNISEPEELSHGVRRSAIVELSTKVVDDEFRLQTTLLHELCHAAAWIVDGNLKPPHGPCFQKWVAIATKAIQPTIPITTKHKFEIHYKYSWECVNPSCSVTLIRRHNRRSIDIKRHVCGRCRGALREVMDTPLSSSSSSSTLPSPSTNAHHGSTTTPSTSQRRPLTEYQRFIQENSKVVAQQLLSRRRRSSSSKKSTTSVKPSPQAVLTECAKLWQQSKIKHVK